MIRIENRINRNFQASGVCIIGDTHHTLKAPISRQDDYFDIVNRKMSAIISMCNVNGLVPLLLGDIFHRAVESHEIVKNSLIDHLYDADFTPIINPGNHDMSGSLLSRKDSLYTIKSSRCAIVNDRSGQIGFVDMTTQDAGTVRVGIGSTPYGQDIPSEVDWDVPCDYGFWMTHHNLPFANHYDDQPVYGFSSIRNVSDVFNGHLHHPSPDVLKGGTSWHNFGSSTRTKKDESERMPVVTIWTPDDGYQSVPLISDTTEHAFDVKTRMSPSRKKVAEAGEFGKRFVDFLSNEGDNEIDIAREFDIMFANGMIDRKMQSFLTDIAEDARKVVTR